MSRSVRLARSRVMSLRARPGCRRVVDRLRTGVLDDRSAMLWMANGSVNSWGGRPRLGLVAQRPEHVAGDEEPLLHLRVRPFEPAVLVLDDAVALVALAIELADRKSVV